jgi:hypothetical protein
MRRLLIVLAAALTANTASQAADPKPDPAGLLFFEQKIRPVLVKECYSCHSAEATKLKGGLRVDGRDALLKGGDTGPAVVPGKPTESLLLKALREDDLALMPPKGKLPDGVIADFEKWIKMGAPDPRTGTAAAATSGIDIEKGRQFWSFRRPVAVAPPQVKDAAWVRSEIDRFLLAPIEAKGLRPASDADRTTLIRRLTIDLHGLPPSPEEVDAFVNDPASDDAALAKVVDRLLASPRYGERWGRHWLDVARYADSNGKDENLTFHEAYLYRDYVIRSFNADKPFNRFVVEQLAGDLLPAADQAERDELLTATGFLVVGPKVLADRDQEKRRMDVIDEQIDTVGRAFLGMTLGCARCHDHKFDPIPTADYYALAGVFGSTHTLDGFKLGNPVVSGWALRPLGGPDGEKQVAARKDYDAKLKKVTDELKKAKAALAAVQDKAAMRSPGGLLGITVDDKDARLVGSWKASQYSKPYVGDGYVHDDKAGKGEKSATFTPKLPRAGEYEVLIAYTVGGTRSTNTPVTVRFDGGEKVLTVDQTKPPKIDGLFHSLGKFKFKAGTEASVVFTNKGTEGHVIVDAVRFVPVGEPAKAPETGMGVPPEVKKAVADAQARVKRLEAQEAELKKAAPPPPRMVMAVRDEEKIEDARVNIRGNPHQLGPAVPRGVLQVATTGPRPTFPATQSGRLQVAEWIASADHPLTARVAANRVWAHLFGEGLVRTVDNFGIQGEKPGNPELLDHLAVQFVKDGWSYKKLIRSIVLSRAYRVGVRADAALLKADPENRLFGRANRRRVEAEVIRDTVLAVSGKLDLNGGGPVVSHFGERAIDNDSKGGINTDAMFKRSVFLPVVRNDIPTVFEVFDFADPDVSTGKRDATTVPTQALYLMNSTFVNTQARAAADRLLTESKDDFARLELLFRRALGRSPTTQEADAALRFLADYRKAFAAKNPKKPAAEADAAAWSAVCLSVFGCNEFRFVE